MKLGDILKSINTGKEPLINRENEKEYVPYIVSRCFSNFPDTIFYANELNAKIVIDRKMHYDYLFNSVRKRKRYSPWQKKEESKATEAVAWFYGVSRRKAGEYLQILTPEDSGKILQEYETAHKD